MVRGIKEKKEGLPFHCLLTINKNNALTTVQSSVPQQPNPDLRVFEIGCVKEKKEGLLGNPFFFGF